MTIVKKEENGRVTFCLTGWLDALSSPELGTEVDGVETAKELVLDFDGVEYISSAGLRQVVAACKRAKALGANFSVIHAGPEVMSIFKLTALDKKMNISGK